MNLELDTCDLDFHSGMKKARSVCIVNDDGKTVTIDADAYSQIILVRRDTVSAKRTRNVIIDLVCEND